ncbi:MAG TPA: Xaa-Pro peptidase family protein [Terriglobales bacterium]|jgi:Xaa-Pro aminopeptidase|nr:Xaa-Pro peptidase family protein [Terriglobales bacterium]
MDHRGRQRRLQAALADNNLDYLLVTHLPNVRYLCGFTGSAGALLVGERGATLFTDGRYRTQARSEASGAKIAIAGKSPAMAAVESLAASGMRSPTRVGVEPQAMTLAQHDQLRTILKGKWKLVSAPPLVERARMVKDKEEIRLIRSAITLGASLFQVARRKIRPGTKEVEVAAAMEFEARRAGAEGMSFSTIIAAGKRSAVVHGRASQDRIPRRGFVVCDFGVILARYCSDRTRTVHVGQPSKAARTMYQAVLDAQQAAIAQVRAGVSAASVDEAARKTLRQSNLAQYFTHSTGHGLGLEIHEAPRLAAGQMQVLEPGMVITVEPGAYIPGKQGVRIEDVVVVTSKGCEVLTPGDKELVVIE